MREGERERETRLEDYFDSPKEKIRNLGTK